METLIFKTVLYTCLLLFTVLFFRNTQKLEANKSKIEKIFFIILLLVIIVRQITYIAMKEYTWLLPLHVCNISAILVVIWLYTRKDILKAPIYLFSFLAAAALVYPAVDYSYLNPLYYTFIIDHIILLYVPFYMIVVYRYMPTKKEFISTFVGLCVLLVIGYALNGPLNENYFYLTDKPLFPDMNTILYMLLYMAVVLACFSLVQYVGYVVLIKKENIKEPI